MLILNWILAKQLVWIWSTIQTSFYQKTRKAVYCCWNILRLIRLIGKKSICFIFVQFKNQHLRCCGGINPYGIIKAEHCIRVVEQHNIFFREGLVYFRYTVPSHNSTTEYGYYNIFRMKGVCLPTSQLKQHCENGT